MRKSQRFGIFVIIGFGKLPTVGWEGGTSVFLRLDTFDTDLLWACFGPHVGGYFGSCGVCFRIVRCRFFWRVLSTINRKTRGH